MIKAVIFDFGGTVHSMGKKKLSEIIAQRLGCDREAIKENVISGLIAMSTNQITENMFWNRLGGKLEGVWEEQLRDNQLFIPIVELVKDLKKRDILTVVLSNTIPPHVKILKGWGWYDYFDKAFLSVDIGLRKPDIRAYEYVLNEIKLRGEECIFVDDLEENLVPARGLGMKTVLVNNPRQTIKDIKNYLSSSVDGLG